MRLVLIGWGAIAHATVDALAGSSVEVVGVAVRDTSVQRDDLPPGTQLIATTRELGGVRPDVVAEAAGRDAVAPWGHAALAAGADYIVSSVSALGDDAVLAALTEAARTSRGHVHIHPGAIAGIDGLAAAKLMGLTSVEHRIIKPPLAWRGTPAETLCALDSLRSPVAFYQANAGATAAHFPQNANVAITTALAGIGIDATHVTLVADPDAHHNRHEIVAEGSFGRLEINITNHPLPDNPKTSALTALSLARAIQNRAAALVV